MNHDDLGALLALLRSYGVRTYSTPDLTLDFGPEKARDERDKRDEPAESEADVIPNWTDGDEADEDPRFLLERIRTANFTPSEAA